MSTPPPEVFAAFIFALVRFAERTLGLTRQALLDVVGLDAALAYDLDARVPYEALLALWEHLIARFPEEPLGLLYAQHVTLEELGVLGHLSLHSASLRESVARFVRFQALLDPFFLITLDEDEDAGLATITLDHLPRVVAMREPIELFCTIMCRNVMQRADAPAHHPARRVSFAHARCHDAAYYEEILGLPTRFEQPRTAITFERELLAARMRGAQPALSHYIDHYLMDMLGALGRPAPPGAAAELSAQVLDFLGEHLSDGQIQQADAARHLRTSARTLQRRLSAEGTTFTQLLTEARQAKAHHLLTTTALPVYEIAGLLGYQDAASFYRAFRHWHDTTPEQVRQRS